MNRYNIVKFPSFVKGFVAFFVLLFSVYFTTCDLPMGLGDPIDWEPPVLTMDKGYSNPLYVRLGTKLSGTVTDNIGVDRVILRNANTGAEMFKANLLPNDRWEIALDFSPEQNGEKIAVEIVAFDRVGNSGDTSIAAITLIIDIRPPIIQDMWISRTNVKTAYLETYHDLFDLERTDPYGQYGTLSENVNKYQNGFFYINGKVSEEETRIEVLGLNIYDADDPNTPLLLTPGESRFSLPKSEGSDYAPIWLVKEEAILNAGNLLWPGYKTNYYENGSRYYYRVAIYAVDRSGNEGESIIIEDEGFFCMWEKGDEPKGIIDRLVGRVVTKGATIPIEFFDDDTLDWAYTGLLTQDQWDGIEDIAPGTKIPQTDNDGKLLWLKERLRGEKNAGIVYDWKYDKKNGTQQEIVDQIAGKTFDERIIYLQTGNDESDTGLYVLFTLTQDKKLDPHPAVYTGSIETLKPRWKGRLWEVDVIDENAPLIVFDTVDTTDNYDPTIHSGFDTIPGASTGDSPEENTFPKLTDGRYFEINGYTLRAYREDQEIPNSVVKFRMAWIPFGIEGGPDDYVTAVQNALKNNYPNSFNAARLAGIQHWEFTPEPASGQGKFIEGTSQPIGDSLFKKQVFRKQFDVLGGADDLKSVYNNFTYNGSRENETKLFVFYAEDNVGHEVFRQLRLLGNKTPPDLAVYDITGKDDIILPATPEIPNLNNSEGQVDDSGYYFNADGNIDEAGRARYRVDLKGYQETGYNAMRPVALSGTSPNTTLLLTSADRTEPYQAYPRDTIIKYWIMAEKSGDLAVDSINMRDITYSTNTMDVGIYNDGDRSLSYIERLPEVTQRVFLFTAKDTLGNEVMIQRTVAVTNAAVLNNITTTTQSSSYGIGQKITIQANFSNLVRWTTEGSIDPTNPNNGIPKLNIRYDEGGTKVLRQINTKTPPNTSTLYLEFEFIIQEGYTGELETMYFGMTDGPAGNDTARNNRPITIPAGTRILDASREDDAFTPRNRLGFDWTESGQGPGKSLQGPKNIILDGIRPVITVFKLDPPSEKINYTDTPNQGYYFKAGETIQFTLTADKPIFTSGDPVIQFRIGNVWRPAAWQRASGANGMVFSALVGNDTPQGQIAAYQLEEISTIKDEVGNDFFEGDGAYGLILTQSDTIRVDRTPPTAPGTTLNGTAVGSSTTTLYYNASPTLAISGNTGESAPIVKTQYSLNNGVTWVDFTNPTTPTAGWTSAGDTSTTLKILPGEWILATRFIDRAGNEGVAPNGITTQPLHVNDAFPKLIAVTPVESYGWHKTGNLQFDLSFEDQVRIVSTGISITLKNRSTANNSDTAGAAVATATATTPTTLSSTIRVSFNVSGKEMKDGLYVSAVDFSNLRDKFGNVGGTWAPSPSTWSGAAGTGTAPTITPNTSTCPNLSAGLRVDAIAPTVTIYSPGNDGIATAIASADDYRNVITLTFRETVMKGSGTIIIKPQKDFYIPPVFENNGYYYDQEADTRHSSNISGKTTWVAGFYDIYNSLPNTAEGRNHRNALTESTTAASQSLTPTASVIPSDILDTGNPDMSRLRMNRRTGQPAGPYVRTTHGLVTGYGYKGEYTGGADADPTGDNNVNFYRRGPDTISGGDDAVTALVPDTSTKWVLAFPYSISNADNVNLADSNLLHTPNSDRANVVPNIRAALVAAKFRWQEIDVTYSNVVVAGSTVTITLDEPLLKGLRWELSYPDGTFTDEAGNPVPIENAYTFWSPGTQKPVIRVDRKSFDARTSAWQAPTSGGTSQGYDYALPAANSGWSIGEFNSIGYRIETETPGGNISWGTTTRRNSTTSNTGPSYDAVTADWTGTIANPINGTLSWDTQLGDTAEGSRRFWVRPNLLRLAGRSGGEDNFTGGRCFYYINGVLRRSSGYLRMFRSYNRDAQEGDFVGTTATTSDRRMASISFGAMEAGKSYVFATAQRTGQTASAMGYEGVFRTVIVLNNIKKTTREGTIANTTVNDSVGKVVVEGSNILSATPSIPGFPVRDGAESGDSRFVKMMYNVRPRWPPFNNPALANNDGYNDRYYWVSTEIVSEWYFRYYGNGGGSQRSGDVNNYLTVSYGDLTYGNNVDHRDRNNAD
jgi:hypothetical protein